MSERRLPRILQISALAVESLSFAARAKQVVVLLAIVSVNQFLSAFYWMKVIRFTLTSILVLVFVSLIDSDLWVLMYSGHGSFSNNKRLNDIIGHLTHSSILVPYHGWWGYSRLFYPVAAELVFISLDYPCKLSNLYTCTNVCFLFETLQAYQPPNSSSEPRSCGEWRVMASGKALFLFIIPRIKHTWIYRSSEHFFLESIKVW